MYEDLIEKFYTRNERIRQNTRNRTKYTGKGVRMKTNMITYWKQNPKFPQERKKRPRCYWPKKKNEKNHKKQQSQTTSVPMYIRKQKKWKHPREEKDTYEYISQEEV